MFSLRLKIRRFYKKKKTNKQTKKQNKKKRVYVAGTNGERQCADRSKSGPFIFLSDRVYHAIS